MHFAWQDPPDERTATWTSAVVGCAASGLVAASKPKFGQERKFMTTAIKAQIRADLVGVWVIDGGVLKARLLFEDQLSNAGLFNACTTVL
jgi:hypothetical protein